jgi:hypothetical protein
VALPFDHPEDVLGVRDPMILAVELDFRARILAKDHHVPDAHLDILVGAYRDRLGVLGFYLAVSGSTIPDSVICSRSTPFATTRAPSGLNFIFQPPPLQ